MKQGIIFDMDGTLWDSSENVAKSWDEAVQRRYPGLRRIRAKDIKDVMGHTMTEIAKLLFPMLEEKEALHLTDVCGTEENAYLRLHGGVLYPDLQATLALLAKRYPLYIVSNCQKGYIEAFLDYYRLWDFFQDRECFGNTGREKALRFMWATFRGTMTRASRRASALCMPHTALGALTAPFCR